MAIDVDLSRLAELSTFAVPGWARGVWQRHSIRTDGSQSHAPRVIWIQTPTLYADIRTLGPEQAPTLAIPDQGFAGLLNVDRQVFHWARPIDLTPGPEGADQGAMFRDGNGLLEVGLFSNYLEEYHQVASTDHCFAASRGAFSIDEGIVRFDTEQPLDIVVCAGTYVTHARRAGKSALRHGRYDASAGTVAFDLLLGDASVFTEAHGTWTVWSDEFPDRDALLHASARP